MKHSMRVGLLIVSLGMISGVIAAIHYRSETNWLRIQLAEIEPTSPPTMKPVQTEPTAIDTDSSLSLNSDPATKEDITFIDRVQELELALLERDQELERLRARFRPIQEAREEATSAPVDRQTWLENLQAEDPERYAEIIQRREAMRQRVNDTFARKAAHFLYRDTSDMDEIEQQEYELMLGLLAETWQLSERMQDPVLERHERWEIGREVMANVRELTPMLEAERDREFYELALQLGYDNGAAAEFVDYINDMIEVSTFGSIWRGQRGGWGRGERN